MAEKATLVIPTEHDRATEVVEEIADSWADRYGGCSLFDGSGRWIDDRGFNIKEPHTVLWCVADSFRHNDLRYDARHVARQLNESAVLLTVEDCETYFVEQDADVTPEVSDR